MSMNVAARLHEANTALKVENVPMPTAGAGELIIKNAFVAINPLDCHMQDVGVFVQEWPAVFGCDVAGTVHEVGSGAETRFKKGDRVIAHTINLTSGRSKDGAFAHYSTVCAVKAAILPDEISFVDGVVIPFAFEAAVCALSLQESTIAMPGVSTPALGLPYPSLDPKPSGKVLVVNGASASSGSMVTQLATAAGVKVMAIAGAKNHDMVKQLGAVEVFDRADTGLVDKIVRAVQKTGEEFIGIFDSVSEPETTSRDLEILEQLGGGHLACTHPPPAKVPANVQAGMIFAVNDVANPVWESYVTRALEQGKLKCFPPPTVVGKGLEYVNEALRRCKDGVSATKLVVEL